MKAAVSRRDGGHAALRVSQRGQAVIAVLLIIGVGIAVLVYTLATPAGVTIGNDKKTAAALARARDALIGRTASDSTIPGSLPCPDLITNIPGTNVPDDGIADLFAGNDCPSYVGRLPWRTLGLPDLRDGSGERLWYALSRNFRDDASASPLNSDTPGQLTVTGSAPATEVVAIVFSPGTVLGTQTRDAAGKNNVANYLEGENATTGDNIFATAPPSGTFNDKLLVITSDALFSVVGMRIAREVRGFLNSYFNLNGYYPFANSYADNTYNCTPLATSGRIPKPSLSLGLPISVTCSGLADWSGLAQPPAWFAANNWHLVTHYVIAPACTFPLSLSNCLGAGGLLTVQGTSAPNDNKRALVIVTGRRLAGQTRPCAGPADCLEDAENTDADNVFVKPMLSAANNDRLVVVAP